MPQITKDQIRSALRLGADANTASSFDELGIDSWGLIELRAILETQFGIRFTDDEWVEMNCPDDVLQYHRDRQSG
jgi:acyl carrier protein